MWHWRSHALSAPGQAIDIPVKSDPIARRRLRASVAQEIRDEIVADLDNIERGWHKVFRGQRESIRLHTEFLDYLSETNPGRNFQAEFFRFIQERKKATDTAALELRELFKGKHAEEIILDDDIPDGPEYMKPWEWKRDDSL